MIKLIEEQSEYPKLLKWDELSDSLKNKAIFRYYQDYPDLYNDMALDMMRPEYCHRVGELLKKYNYDFIVDDFPFEPTLYRIIRYSSRDDVFDRRISLPLINGDPFTDYYSNIYVAFSLPNFTVKYNYQFDSLSAALESLWDRFERDYSGRETDADYDKAMRKYEQVNALLSRKVRKYVADVKEIVEQVEAIQQELFEKYPIRDIIEEKLSKDTRRVYVIEYDYGEDEETIARSYVE